MYGWHNILREISSGNFHISYFMNNNTNSNSNGNNRPFNATDPRCAIATREMITGPEREWERLDNIIRSEEVYDGQNKELDII